ncbi:MAG: flagellar motor switch protein FliN [Pirellulales bacterium]|nr:flagellar motor switch protein FliN [Pirellulales bacterium]
MADPQAMSQEEIEKLLSQGTAGAAPAAKPAVGEPAASDPQSPPPAKADPAPSVASAAQSAATGESVLPPPPPAPSPGPMAGEGSMAEKDIDFLLQQAEQALESITADDAKVIPQGVAPFCFEELTGAPVSTEKATLDLVRDVDLDLKIELGRTQMYLEDVLRLRKGSVVPLDKLAGDPVDIYVNGRLIARGEVLVLNDNFCVRVAELVAGVQIQA